MTTISLDTVLEHSFRDFHATGLHYISLPWPYTGKNMGQGGYQKFYFFEGKAADSSEVINPHNHRYMFNTQVLQGELIDLRYTPDVGCSSKIYRRYDYMTPLNGGAGFTEAGLTRLRLKETTKVERGHALVSAPEDIHTIKVKSDTVLSIVQYQDMMALDEPTQLFSVNGKMPSLNGLYKKWEPDALRSYLRKLRTLVALPNIV